ncbi:MULTISPECIES: hypothetical protein [Rhodobacterales]|uniref:hypothetical protein n=1 Tax=Rhodobacterales TaxID=204455 RepID=UPI0015F082F0|nr:MULTISPECIES: hypothetical protein [Rhodobacterales]MDO6591667.1 hypothetical protein [Yoonia sp. 1_MG-2023]
MRRKQSRARKSDANANNAFSPIRADLLDRLTQTCDQLERDDAPSFLTNVKIAA